MPDNNEDTVAHLAPSSGHCKAFSPTIPPLQVALSFACSVASLSHSPSFQLPGWHSLHCGSLADYLLGWGRASTCTAGHTELQCTSMPKLPCGIQELPPSTHDDNFLAHACLATSLQTHASCVRNIIEQKTKKCVSKIFLVLSRILVFSGPPFSHGFAIHHIRMPYAHCAHSTTVCKTHMHSMLASCTCLFARFIFIAGGHTASNAPDLF